MIQRNTTRELGLPVCHGGGGDKGRSVSCEHRALDFAEQCRRRIYAVKFSRLTPVPLFKVCEINEERPLGPRGAVCEQA